MLKIHEAGVDGRLAQVFLQVGAGGLELVDDGEVLSVPETVLPSVMERYGAPFDPSAPILAGGELKLQGDCSLRHVRHLAGYDVIARDYVVYERPGAEALCALATTVAGALAHLARAFQQNSPSS